MQSVPHTTDSQSGFIDLGMEGRPVVWAQFKEGRDMKDLERWGLTNPGLNVNACYRPSFTTNADGELQISVPVQVHNDNIARLVDLLRMSGLFTSVTQ